MIEDIALYIGSNQWVVLLPVTIGADIEAEQIAEGERYTTTVTSIDASKGLLFMDNGDKIPIEDLSAQPAVDDKLTYIKTFDYKTSSWDGMPKRLDSETIINIEIIGNTLTE